MTLVELMIAMFIGVVAISQILGLFANQLHVYQAHKRTVDAQQDARLVTELMLQNIRMAGFMIPTYAGISSIDGGNTNADAVCVSDAGVLDETRVDEAMNPFDRASLVSAVDANATLVTVVAAEMDIDQDGDNDFTVGRGIIISDGTRTHCARIAQIAGNQIRFSPATPAGFTAAVANGRAVPALIYQLTGAGLMRNGRLVSPDVEDVQIEFAVDANDDGVIGAGEFPIHDLNTSNPSLVRGLQISVMTRASQPDPNFVGGGRGALGNRGASGTSDRFQRRVVSVNAALRNMI